MSERFVLRSVCAFILIAIIALARQARSQEVIMAMDDTSQSAYSDGWQAGDNGGFGFQPWEFDNFFEAAFSPRPAAQFIATNNFVDIPANGPAFGQTNANRPYWGYTAWAFRPFETPLQIGQTFSVDLDNPILSPLDPLDPGGVMLQLRDASKNEKLSLLAQSGFNNAEWTVFDAAMESTNTGFSSISSADGGFNFALTLTDTESYEMTLTPLTGGAPLNVSGTFRNPGDPVSEVSLVVYSNGSSSDGSREFYANNLRIVEPVTGDSFVWDGLGDGAWTDLRWTIAGQFPGAADTATIVNDTVFVNGAQSAAQTVVESGRLHVVGQLNGAVEIRADGAIMSTGTISGDVINSGVLELDGGTFNATSLENRDSGVINGFGTVVPPIQNSGTVRAAGGTLVPSNGIQASSGTIQIDPDGGLDLSAASTDASADFLFHDGAGATSLNLGANSMVVSADYTNANFGTGDNFRPRANIAGTGQILASGDVAQHLAGDVSAGDSANPLLDFGDVHVGTQTTLNYRIKNAGTTGPSVRGAIQTAVGGGNLTDSRLTGTGVTAGDYGPVAVDSESGALTVTFDATQSGPLVGQTVGIVNNFDNVSGQVLSIEGSAWNLAVAEVSSGIMKPVDLGVVHVGDVAEQALTVTNQAAPDGFSEGLNASFSGTTGAVLATGSINLLPAGATDRTSLIVAVDTTTAGPKSGTGTIAFVSDGDGTSALGQTPLTEQQQVIDVTGQVNNFASAAIVILSGDGELSRQSVNEYSLDLGTTWPSRGPLTTELGVTNDAAAPADDLSGTFTEEAADFMLNGFDAFSGLTAGGTRSGFSVELDPLDLGSVTGVVRLAPRSENVSGFSGPLAEITINLTALVTLPGDANGDRYVDVTDFNIWNDNRGGQNTTWTTGDFNGDGMTNDLDFTIWNDNKYTSIPLGSTVPEPNGAWPLLLSLAILGCHVRDSRSRSWTVGRPFLRSNKTKRSFWKLRENCLFK